MRQEVLSVLLEMQKSTVGSHLWGIHRYFMGPPVYYLSGSLYQLQGRETIQVVSLFCLRKLRQSDLAKVALLVSGKDFSLGIGTPRCILSLYCSWKVIVSLQGASRD